MFSFEGWRQFFNQKKFSSVFFSSSVFGHQNPGSGLDPYPDPDSIEMLDPDPYPDSMKSGSTAMAQSCVSTFLFGSVLRGWDLDESLDHLTANAEVETVLGSMSASSGVWGAADEAVLNKALSVF
jgi:hypothetical protein